MRDLVSLDLRTFFAAFTAPVDGDAPRSNWRSAWFRNVLPPTWCTTRRRPKPVSFQCHVGTCNSEIELKLTNEGRQAFRFRAIQLQSNEGKFLRQYFNHQDYFFRRCGRNHEVVIISQVR